MGIWADSDIPSSKGLSPTTKGPVPSDERVCPQRRGKDGIEIMGYSRVSGEISQYAQFAAAFGRIVFGKSAANGQRIDSRAAIRTLDRVNMDTRP